MKSRSLTVVMAAALIALSCPKALALVQFNDGGVHDIDYMIDTDVLVDYQAPGMQTTVNILPGGGVSDPYSLSAYNDSRVNIPGGTIGRDLYAYDSSAVTVSNGTIGSSLRAYDGSSVTVNDGCIGKLATSGSSSATVTEGSIGTLEPSGSSSVTVSGGWVSIIWSSGSSSVTISSAMGYEVWAFDDSSVNLYDVTISDFFNAEDNCSVNLYGVTITSGPLCANRNSSVIFSGGMIGEGLSVHDDSSVTVYGGEIGGDLIVEDEHNPEIAGGIIIHGYDFAVDGVPFGYGELTSFFGGSNENEPARRLTGILADGSILNNDFYIGYHGKITLVPEPATVFLLGLGGLAVIRRRRTALRGDTGVAGC